MPTVAVRVTSRFEQELDIYLHLRQLWAQDPERYCRNRLGINPTWQQRNILKAIQPDGARVTVRSGHGIGKDAIASAIILWFMETRDYPRVPCTAPTGHQLYDILWGEIAKWMRKADFLSQARGDHPRLWISKLFKHTQDMLYDLSAPKEWYAVARTARKESPEGLQGFHASDIEVSEDGSSATIVTDAALLFVIDEASGVPDPVYEVIEGALSSPSCRLLEIGNATRNTGSFAAHHKHQRSEYTALHFRSSDSPLVDPDYRPRLVRKFGEGSNVVRVRADGEFPKADDDTLIAIEWCEAALEAKPPVALVGRKRLGVDVARYGDDRTTFVLRQGNVVPFIDIKAKQDTMVTAGQAIAHGERLQVDDICVDVVGLGAGVYDRIVEIMRERKGADQWTCNIIPVNAAEAAPTHRSDNDAQGAKMRDFLWLEMRAWLRDESPCFMAIKEYCEDLAGELASPKFTHDSSGRIVVESKDAMKKRLKASGADDVPTSPDLADGLGCTFAPLPKGPPAVVAPDMQTASRWRI